VHFHFQNQKKYLILIYLTKELIPLLRSEQLKWLDISINNLGVSDLQDIWSEIETQARRTTILEELTVPLEEMRDLWASKVILLPSEYTVERFPLSQPFVNAHKQYYN
jgi:hypothetical protein